MAKIRCLEFRVSQQAVKHRVDAEEDADGVGVKYLDNGV